MTGKTMLTVVMLFAILTSAAPAQPLVVDKTYEAQKEAEIATARLQLATQPGSAAIQELNDVEDALRRLKIAKTPDQRTKIAAELEAAITRLKIAANPVGGR